jgi:hypothetical protein
MLVCLAAVLSTVTAAAAESPGPTPPAADGRVVAISMHTGRTDGPAVVLLGEDARQQVVVTGTYADGKTIDLTRVVVFTSQPAGIVDVDDHGMISPLANGMATVTAAVEGTPSLAATAAFTVESFEQHPGYDFANCIVPILTKNGCNSGGCHGAANGQNGFRLSLLGFEPAEDYEHLIKESRARRLSFAAPDQSLLLQKGTGLVPHGGGGRLEPGSTDYTMIRNWIAAGGPPSNPAAPRLAKLEVYPAWRLLTPQAEQQLLVTAVYSDGSREDVTGTAIYEANVPEMASISKRGLVKTNDETGDVAVMVRYQTQVAVARATIPLGAPLTALPPTRNLIDKLVFDKLRLLGLPPSAVADDATFLRRLMVDLGGRLPTAAEADAFLSDPSPGKRDAVIEKVLASGDYADMFATKWSGLLRNQLDSEFAEPGKPGNYAFHLWIRQAIQENMPYDQMVRHVMTAAGEASENPAVLWYRAVKDVNAQVEDTAQLFLGQRIQCAKCHHHPFERWSQEDYTRFSAFFTQLGRKPGLNEAEQRIYHKSGIATAKHPKNGEPLTPAGLGGTPLTIDAGEDPRLQLADWLTSPENPFFARSLVNRTWKHFFGRGLVDPEDDMRATNPPSNPELLDALEKRFRDKGFDMKDLVRTICQSTAYQLGSEPNQYNANDRQNFSRYYPRRLPAEVLCDAIDATTGSKTNFGGMPPGSRAVQLPYADYSSEFLTVFGRPKGDSACECERGTDANLSQGLHLVNSAEILGKPSNGSGRAAALAKDKAATADAKLRELYLTAFGRPPTADEQAFVLAYLDQKSFSQQAFEDVVWSLLNSKEFLFNH